MTKRFILSFLATIVTMLGGSFVADHDLFLGVFLGAVGGSANFMIATGFLDNRTP